MKLETLRKLQQIVEDAYMDEEIRLADADRELYNDLVIEKEEIQKELRAEIYLEELNNKI